ncbi:Na+/H+ antiporter [Haladaptatus sp. NG-SE-30]
MAETGITTGLINLLAVFIIAGGVGIFVAKVGRFPYTIALLLAGIAVSVLGIDIDITLTHDLILLVLLPPLLFEGAATTDLERFRENIVPILVLAVPGLIVSILVLGWLGSYAFGYPILLATLFAAMVLPTDPVSVLALFEELGAPDRLSVLVEGESLINDGVGVVVFSTLFGLVVTSQEKNTELSELITPQVVGDAGVEIVTASLGGLIVGLAAGYAIYRVMANLDEHMTEIVLTLILAYGSFLLAEHYLHVSGVIATVTAGLFIGNRGAEYAMSPQTKISIFNTWETGAFLVNTLIFVLIGAKTPLAQILDNWQLIAIAIVLTLLVRSLVVYPFTGIVNRFSNRNVPLTYQHVMIWGGLHASIPIALVLGLPDDFPRVVELRAMVFGVAAFSLVVQGLTMGNLLDRLGVVTRTETEELYELLLGRARAVDSALDAAERLYDRGDLPNDVYSDFHGEYEQEKEDLSQAISRILSENPDLRREELLVGERRVLKQEKSAIMSAMRSGVISDDIGEKLLEEVDLKLDRVDAGDSTVRKDPEKEGYEEFWRSRIDEYGIDISAGDD